MRLAALRLDRGLDLVELFLAARGEEHRRADLGEGEGESPPQPVA